MQLSQSLVYSVNLPYTYCSFKISRAVGGPRIREDDVGCISV